MKKDIPIVLAGDIGYLTPIYMVMLSILENSNSNYNYIFYILLNEKMDESIERYFQQLIEKYRNCAFHYICMEKEYEEISGNIEHINFTTFYRLAIPDILKDNDKCLYLDADIIVNSDISELYNIELGNFYLAGVKNVFPEELIEEKAIARAAQLGVESLATYINAGVLLMNLKRMREDRLTQRFFECMHKGDYPYNDQDIINYVCESNIKLIDLKYNVMISYTMNCREYVLKIFDKNQIKKAFKQPVIIHYASPAKPWKSKCVPLAGEWYKYMKYIPGETLKNMIGPFIRKNNGSLKYHIGMILNNFLVRKYYWILKGIK